jgi:hypothetical protein
MGPMMREWLGAPSRIAMLLGAGALSIAVTRADTASQASTGDTDSRMPQQSSKSFADLVVWQESGRVFIAEDGKPAEEVQLANTAEAELLCQLLEQQGATADKPHTIGDRIILVGGGGCGFDWTPPGKTTAGPREHASDKPTLGERQTAPQQAAPSIDPGATAIGQRETGKTSVYR